jgi:hypothetical protein
LKNTRTLFTYLTFSCIAGVLIILVIGTASSHLPPLSFEEKAGIVGVFVLCCGLGISFTFRPNWLRRQFPKSQSEETNTPPQKKQSFQGHHPSCATFQNHTIQWKEKTWCAGCLGLFIGLCDSIVFMILYLTTDFQISKMMALLLVLLGLCILILVYIETLYQSRYARVHVVMNSLLPLSFFIITIAIAAGTGNVVYGLFTILLCFLWLDTRIQLSKWHHSLLCTQCSESCKMFTVSA